MYKKKGCEVVSISHVFLLLQYNSTQTFEMSCQLDTFVKKNAIKVLIIIFCSYKGTGTEDVHPVLFSRKIK